VFRKTTARGLLIEQLIGILKQVVGAPIPDIQVSRRVPDPGGDCGEASVDGPQAT
jgi:hypothetical protein